MLKNYLRTALRNLLKSKGYSAINIAGLAMGIATCILIMLYVQDELSYDRHNVHADRIYRIGVSGLIGGNDFNIAQTPAPMAAALTAEFPEVVAATRFRSFGYPVLRSGDKAFSEERFYWADSNFFDVFSVKFIDGDQMTALANSNSLVLTRSAAQRYFGDESPMGKLLNADNRRDYLVTGLIEDFPHNSHFHFDMIASLSSYDDSRNQHWVSHNYYTYVLLHPNSDARAFEEKLDELIKKYVGPQIEQATGVPYEKMIEAGTYLGYFTQPLTDIHLYSDLDEEVEANGNSLYVYIFTVVALAILLIAIINFMNLATARSASRAREVGIRKTLGSTPMQLVGQFLAESVSMSLIAFMLSLIIVYLALPPFNQLTGKAITLDLFASPQLLLYLTGFALLVGLISGSYPAFFMAGFKPLETLKGHQHKGGRSSWMRSGLVIFQFTLSVMLLVGTLVVRNQMTYIQDKNLGFDGEQVLIVKKTDDIGQSIEAFKNRLHAHPNVIATSNSTSIPGRDLGSDAFRNAESGGEETHLVWNFRTDHGFFDTYEMAAAGGRFFSKDFATDSSGVILNEAAVAVLGLQDPVGKEISELSGDGRGDLYRVLGVVKNFHFESLHQKIRPLAILLFHPGDFGRYISVRIKTTNIDETLAHVRDSWQEFAGNQAFEYVFFSNDFGRLYQNEKRTSQLLNIFSGLAIFIACLGLLGLASFTTEQRTKEIGIRKVLGASVASVVLLLFREFAKWVLIANVVAWPLAYFIMNDWLQNFAYRTEIGWLVFAVAALLAMGTAFVTVSYQTIRAAFSNPVKALRYE